MVFFFNHNFGIEYSISGSLSECVLLVREIRNQAIKHRPKSDYGSFLLFSASH